MTQYGVIVRNERIQPALAVGADYPEPIIVGTLAIEGEAGWIRNPDYQGPDAAPSFAILVPGHVKLSDPAVAREETQAYFDTIMPIIRSAAQPGARVVLGSGGARTIPEGVDLKAGRDRFALSVVAARDAAERNDLAILLEPLNRGEANLINSLSEAVEFLDEHGIERVRVVADLNHIMLEAEPLSVVVSLGARIGEAHICDTGRTPPGQGDWPLAEFVHALKTGGYDGPITIEANFTDFEPELEAALAYVRGLG